MKKTTWEDSTATPESLQMSFFTVQYCTTVSDKLMSCIHHVYISSKCLAKLRDKDSRSTLCVKLMLETLREHNWLGMEHDSVPLLTNWVTTDRLQLTEIETQRGVNLLQHSKRVLNMHGRTAFFPWRDISKAKKGWTRKHRLPLFRGASTREEKDTAKPRHVNVRKEREKSYRRRLDCKPLISPVLRRL